MVPKEVEVKACRMVPRQILRQIPCAERILVPQVVQFPDAVPAEVQLRDAGLQGG